MDAIQTLCASLSTAQRTELAIWLLKTAPDSPKKGKKSTKKAESDASSVGSAEKPKREPTAWNLFLNTVREAVKAGPDASFKPKDAMKLASFIKTREGGMTATAERVVELYPEWRATLSSDDEKEAPAPTPAVKTPEKPTKKPEPKAPKKPAKKAEPETEDEEDFS